MLIYLEEDVAAVDYGSDVQLASAIEALFHSVRLGIHFVAGNRKTLQALSANLAFGALTRKTISIVENELTQSHQLISLVRWKIHVSPSYLTIQKRSCGDIIDVPLTILDHVLSCVLLGENLDDTKVFTYAAKHYSVENKLSACGINYEFQGGGGASTPQVLENCLRQNRWCIVITDSDKKSPNGKAHTAVSAQCHGIAASMQKVSLHISLPSHEVENFVPPSIASAALLPYGNSGKIDDVMSKCGTVGNELYLHTDLKQGMTVKRIRAFPLTSPDRQYWNGVANRLVSSGKLSICGDIDTGVCKHEDCGCYVTSQIESKLLDKIIDHLEKHSPHDTYKQAKSCPWISDWLELGRVIFEWGLARKPMRV
jgi:hypothetical protein